jgi:DMSO reductase family type II enzyme heme b subunit
MPGTPMPSSSTMTPKQMVDLVHYIRSMSTEEQRRAAALNRETILASSVDAVPEAADADQWAQVVPVGLRMTPLWWRNDADPDLTVQAVHDGEQIAVRLTWRDGTEDGHAARSESFEDAVAMELYRGEAEPFLGMGDAESPVDVWFWDADRQGEPLAVEDLYPNTVVDQFPFSETVVASAELDRDGARTADQPEISLPARASGNAITPTDDPSGASSLAVGGPGTVTFRIPRSQLVEARGQWNEGRWSVVMTRKLSVASPSDGVSLEPGGRASVAFAVWDGSQQDRDGKKLITIWQDIELEN